MALVWNVVPEARLKCPVQIGFINTFAVLRGHREVKKSLNALESALV